jgi:hypothetical protein
MMPRGIDLEGGTMQPKGMAGKNISNPMLFLCLGMLLVLACTLVGGPPIQPPDPSLVETEIALRVIFTNLAGKDLTRQAMETALAQ